MTSKHIKITTEFFGTMQGWEQFCFVFLVFYVLHVRSTVTSTTSTNSSVHVLPGKIHCFQSRFAGVLREKTAQDFGLV